MDEIEVFALFAAGSGLKGEFGHADDAVHGRADFVAHVGEEGAFGAVGGLGGFLGAEQFLGGALAVGDVAVAENFFHRLYH